MKKNFKTFMLNKQTISSLEIMGLHGGLKPSRRNCPTMDKTCQSQDGSPCAPPPADPRPDTAVSKCTPCSDVCG